MLPYVIAILAVIVLVLIALVVVRRRRSSDAEVLPPPELSEPVDYTSMTYEEPTTWADRLKRASPATKVLIALIPIVLIAGLVIVYLAFVQPGTTPSEAETGPPPEITDVSAIVASPERIVVRAETTLPDGTIVTGAMNENGEDFRWYNADTATAQVSDGRIQLELLRDADGPVPDENADYTITLLAPVNGNQVVRSAPVPLEVPSVNQSGFFQVASADPTATPEPTVAPTTAPTRVPPTAAPTSAPTPSPEQTAVYTATVFNGGNIRAAPSLDGAVLGQLHAGEVVTLYEKTSDGQWYYLEAPEATGWSSATLLTIDPAVAEQVPLQGAGTAPTRTPSDLTATVFNGGNVRAAPNLQGEVLDQINANESVELLERTPDGVWFRIVNERGVEGWVHQTLLTIDARVFEQVPVAEG